MEPLPASGLAAAALALLGARRRARQPRRGRPTTGERFAQRGIELARLTAGAGTALERLVVGATAGTITVVGTAGAAALRGASNVSSSIGGGAVALVGEAAARTGGLVIDGGLSLTDLLRGRRAS
jgi:hypothetical protein